MFLELIVIFVFRSLIRLICFRSLSRVHTEIVICNVVRAVLDGKALVSPILDILERSDINMVMFLVKVSSFLPNLA